MSKMKDNRKWWSSEKSAKIPAKQEKFDLSLVNMELHSTLANASRISPGSSDLRFLMKKLSICARVQKSTYHLSASPGTSDFGFLRKKLSICISLEKSTCKINLVRRRWESGDIFGQPPYIGRA